VRKASPSLHMNADSSNGAIVPRKHMPVLDRCFHTP
jgi:hypothetical protein